MWKFSFGREFKDNDLNDLNDLQRFTKFIDREFCALNYADNFMETFLFRDSEWAMPRKRGRCFIVTRLKCEVFGGGNMQPRALKCTDAPRSRISVEIERGS